MFLMRWGVLCLPLAVLFTWLEGGELEKFMRHDKCFIQMGRTPVWCHCVLFFVFSTAMLYVAALAKARTQPAAMRRRALLRCCTFVVGFACTYGVRAVVSLLPNPSKELWHVGACLIALNGAVNVGTYIGWMTYSESLSSAASQSQNVHTMEQLVIDRYFDLTLLDDEVCIHAQRQTALAIAALEQHMLHISKLDTQKISPPDV